MYNLRVVKITNIISLSHYNFYLLSYNIISFRSMKLIYIYIVYGMRYMHITCINIYNSYVDFLYLNIIF